MLWRSQNWGKPMQGRAGVIGTIASQERNEGADGGSRTLFIGNPWVLRVSLWWLLVRQALCSF